jgi:hypothetical protein
MTNEEHRRMESLCRQIQIEPDQNVLLRLISELADLLEVSRPKKNRARINFAHGNGHPSEFNPYITLAGNRRISELLSAMIDATSANYGNVQLLDSSQPGLKIVAQCGFSKEFLDYFATVCNGSFCCGEAMNRKSRVLVNDVLTDPLFQDAEARNVMLRAGVRACQSTPLFEPSGSFIGMVSTHYQQPTQFDPSLWERVDTLVADFAKALPQESPAA